MTTHDADMDHDPLDCTGRVALVTGGTKGIGFVIAETLLAAGAEVMVCGRGEPQRLPSGGGRTASFTAADLRDAEQAAAVVESTVATYGRLDVTVNNAGGSPDADAATVSTRFVDKVVALNLLAPFYVAQPANAVMQEQAEGGVILNIGSVAARRPAPGTSAYNAAKAGLAVLTRSLALEWAPKVRVNSVSPGLVQTEAQVYAAGVERTIPMGRLATPADVAAVCLMLAAPAAAFVTGADVFVDGGGETPAFLGAPDA